LGAALSRKKSPPSASRPLNPPKSFWCYISKVLANHHLEIVTNLMTTLSHRDRAIAVARRKGVARAKDFDAVGIPRVYLRRLRDEGVLIRPARGFYQLADAELSAAHSLAEAAEAAPKGVIALLSALQFHGLT